MGDAVVVASTIDATPGGLAVDDGNWIGWLMGIGLAGLLLFQCASEPSPGPDYGPDCVVVYYSNGPMCE
jgi:hypothetical protein